MSKIITYTHRTDLCIMKRDCYDSISPADECEKEHFLRNAKPPYDIDFEIPIEGHYTGHKVIGVDGTETDEFRHSGVVYGWLEDMIVVSVDGEKVKDFYWNRLEEEDLSEWEDRFPYSLTQWGDQEICRSFIEDGEVSIILED